MSKDKMELELEESITILEATIGEFKYLQTTLDEEERELYEHGIQTKEIKAIETVLQALENSIPKKKIEDRLQELLNKLASAGLDGFYDEVKDIEQELLKDK